jgi:hypothetical protein
VVADKVVSLWGDPIYQGSPDPDVVRELERWLERARTGEVVGIAVAVHFSDGATGSSWGGVISMGVVGQCFGLAQRIIRKMNGWTNND